MAIKGFNFDVDMNELASYVEEQGFTLEELGVSDFKIPSTGIFTFNQLMEIYTNNKNIYDHLIREIRNANDKKIYDIYTTIYQSLMVTNLNFDYFTYDNNTPRTYTEYLKMRNSTLYRIIMECKSTSNSTDKRSIITRYINNIVENIYRYIDRDEFKFIFQNIPTVSLDYIRTYMFKVLNFFKSYTVDILDGKSIYKFDDPLENYIPVVDEMKIKDITRKRDIIITDDYSKMIIKIKPNDSISLGEKIYFN